ncbi:MAG TPA: substrate-binding domain-containing protein [Abditibacteriaceae bacterium]|jgi:phosphate transport system substrate-binding protein
MKLFLTALAAFLLAPPLLAQTTTPESTTPPIAAPVIIGITAKNYPRIDGSSSTFPLAQLLLARVLGVNAEQRRSTINPYAAGEPTLSLSFARDTRPAQLKEFARLQRANAHNGTHESYEALIKGAVDLILVAREPSPDEAKLAAQKKVAFTLRPIARDALVFLVNRQNPLRNISSEHLHAIYEGKITHWKAVGGPDEPIRPYTRDRNSGSEELMRSVFQKERPMLDGGERMISSMAGLLDAVGRNPRALGYSIWYYETVMNPREEHVALAVDGVLPTRATIGDGTYKLFSPVLAVTRADAPAGSPASLLREWLPSKDGQELVVQSGNVPLP